MDLFPMYLWTGPMFHCNGWCLPWGMAVQFETNICLRKVRPKDIFDNVTNYKDYGYLQIRDRLLRRFQCIWQKHLLPKRMHNHLTTVSKNRKVALISYCNTGAEGKTGCMKGLHREAGNDGKLQLRRVLRRSRGSGVGLTGGCVFNGARWQHATEAAALGRLSGANRDGCCLTVRQR
ncbi:hypothetical protein AHAS_Ahas16G0150600 [Arachis hypogaea]